MPAWHDNVPINWAIGELMGTKLVIQICASEEEAIQVEKAWYKRREHLRGQR